MKIAMWTSVALGVWACGKHPNGSKSSKVAGPTANGSDHAVAPNSDPTEPPPAPTVRPNTKGDCSTQYAPRPKRDPNPMCKIDGGTFRMGDDKFNMRVKLSPYYMDEFEVTVAQVVFYLNATHDDSCIDPVTKEPCFGIAGPSGGNRSNGFFARKLANGRIVPEAGKERRPFRDASREGAMRYCAWVGKTLPTEPQWEFAARHDPKTGKDLIYPWGDTFDGKRARCDHAVCPDGPDDNDPVDVGLYDGTHGHADGRSPWGLYDMAGNAAELVADCQHEYAPCTGNGGVCVDPPPAPPQPIISEPPPPPPGTECVMVVRGGGVQGDIQLRTFDQETFDTGGFRCVRSAP